MMSRDEGWVCSDIELWNDLNGDDGERREIALLILDAAVDLATLRAGPANVFDHAWQNIFSASALRADLGDANADVRRAAQRMADEVGRLDDLCVVCPCVARRRGVIRARTTGANAFFDRRLMEISHG